MAKSPVPGAAIIFKSCFIVFSLVLASAPDDMGCRLRLRHQHRKKAKQFSLELNKRSKRPYRNGLKYNHHLIAKHDRHAAIIQLSASLRSSPRSDFEAGRICVPADKLSVMRGRQSNPGPQARQPPDSVRLVADRVN
jgi:hypothetical protein